MFRTNKNMETTKTTEPNEVVEVSTEIDDTTDSKSEETTDLEQFFRSKIHGYWYLEERGWFMKNSEIQRKLF